MDLSAQDHRVYSLLIAEDGISSLISSFYTNPIEKYSLRLAVLFLISSFLFLPFETTRLLGGSLGLITAALFFFYSFASLIWNLKYILTPTKSYITILTNQLKKEEELINRLSNEDPDDLERTKLRLEFERDRLSKRIGFLLGAVDKLGLIPAVVALYLTYAKTMNDPALSKVPYPVLGFISGIYLGGIIIKHVLDRLEHMIMTIESAKQKSTRRGELGTLTNHSVGTL